MSQRPEALWALFAELKTLDGVGPKTAQALEGLDIVAPRDLLFTLPHGVIDRRPRDSVQDANLPGVVTVEVTVGRHMKPAQKGRPYRIHVEDAQTGFQLVFFHGRSDYLGRVLPEGSRRIVSGRVELFDGMAQMVHPDHILPPDEAASLPAFEPVYPLTGGVTQKLMARASADALTKAPELDEWIDGPLKAREGWPDWRAALEAAHAPDGADALSPAAPARARLAYDELLAHQLTLALARVHRRKGKGRSTRGDGALRRKVLAALPFRPTGAQMRAMDEIAEDMAGGERMNRLLQGDVGAGKTLVAFMALLVAVEAGGQGVMMAPTEILARQHLEGLRPLAESAGVVVEILTGRDKGSERKAKLAALERGDIQILVGTHAVFQADVAFRDLRLAIVDEQHRFGVRQRLELGRKGAGADVLVMTATPIPRSLALAQYGDMDVSVLDEKPPGRKPIRTALVSAERMQEVVEHLVQAVAEGRQAYWVCPLVEESEAVDLTAAEERFKRLRAVLGEGMVGLVHGQMPPAEKDAAMARFVAGETQVLVATTVIEVGVNVPNATIMVIERAEWFGLAQLHQLRGRVGRGEGDSTCLLMYQPPLGEAGMRRLKTLRETEDGFRISEVDLEMRGAGDLIGTAQSGLPRFKVADLEHQSGLMAMAQSDARKLLADDPTLESPRGRAAKMLLWLMRQDEAIRLISVG
ncbi:ATP-dependent DNA helicase RecG [Salipiger bermudensis]|uniref:ATP-dependent DNA helicase RecG n=1 Tax=Salipiger bermudensis TaxID=344736 RepID=UPI001A8C5AAF|nr:ATP-dependent DNA helicase RecG [Salipiger bermudensis]MBN9677362.1 ATP-dependent DNA helicase RecG [Salipiger bermudensis]